MGILDKERQSSSTLALGDSKQMGIQLYGAMGGGIDRTSVKKERRRGERVCVLVVVRNG